MPRRVSRRCDRFWQRRRFREPRGEIEGGTQELRATGGTEYAAQDNVFGEDNESECGDEESVREGRNFEIGRILQLKSEIRNLKLDCPNSAQSN